MNAVKRRTQVRCGTALAGLGLLLMGCDTESAITTPVLDQSVELRSTLVTALQDEYHAEAVYTEVLRDLGPVNPFANIIGAEVRHSDAIALLLERRGWPVPADEWAGTDLPHFSSVAEACAAGVEGELANVAVYDVLLRPGDLPADVLQVFTSNRAASLERHLPAFQRCSR